MSRLLPSIHLALLVCNPTWFHPSQLGSSAKQLGLPKPLIYTHEFSHTLVNLIESRPPKGFQSANELFQRNRVLQVLPPFHVSLRMF